MNLKNWFMRYLVINLFVITLLFTGCKKEKSTNDRILEIVKDSLKVEKPFNKILILQEHGCGTCNKKFADYIVDQKQNDSTLVILSLQNISGYINADEIKDVIIDRKQLFYKANVLNHSAVILMKKNEIDTILNFSDARVFNQNLEYLSER